MFITQKELIEASPGFLRTVGLRLQARFSRAGLWGVSTPKNVSPYARLSRRGRHVRQLRTACCNCELPVVTVYIELTSKFVLSSHVSPVQRLQFSDSFSVTRFGLRSLSETASYITPRLRTKFRERAFSFFWPSVMELSTHRFTHSVWHKLLLEQVKNSSFKVSIWHSVDTIIFCFIHITYIFSVLAFLSFIATFYCSAPMFLRQFVIGAL